MHHACERARLRLLCTQAHLLEQRRAWRAWGRRLDDERARQYVQTILARVVPASTGQALRLAFARLREGALEDQAWSRVNGAVCWMAARAAKRQALGAIAGLAQRRGLLTAMSYRGAARRRAHAVSAWTDRCAQRKRRSSAPLSLLAASAANVNRAIRPTASLATTSMQLSFARWTRESLRATCCLVRWERCALGALRLVREAARAERRTLAVKYQKWRQLTSAADQRWCESFSVFAEEARRLADSRRWKWALVP